MARASSLALAVVLLVASAIGDARATARVAIGTVLRVDDGDSITVRIGDRVERVRYIGVDAPELGPTPRRGAIKGTFGGDVAARLNASLVAGRRVRLELDVETRDAYGRLLAYVWVGEVMVNAALLARGYARAAPIAPNLRYAARFATLEARARDARRGLWGLVEVAPTR